MEMPLEMMRALSFIYLSGWVLVRLLTLMSTIKGGMVAGDRVRYSAVNSRKITLASP